MTLEELPKATKKGVVWLVGAGPGDAGLLTLRGLDCLRRADVVVFDRLVGPGVLSLIPPGAQKIDVGKSCGRHGVSQHQIQEILLDQARRGKTVVRLKGGDPFLFGRGAEEMAWLEDQGVACLMVPGVTSALAAPACAGIAVTSRDCSPAVHVVTAQGREGKDWNPCWETLAAEEGTLVFLMSLGSLDRIAQGLMEAGKAPQTPAAVIQRGTTSRQRVLRASLDRIAQEAREAAMESPALTVVGPAAAMNLEWRRHLPLAGQLVVVTRARDHPGTLSEQLRRLGAEVVDFPSISTEADFSDPPLAELNFSRYSWLAFTSPRGVEYALQWLMETGRDLRDLAGIKLAAIGPATAQALKDRGLRPDLIPQVYDGAHLGRALAAAVQPGQRALLLRSRQANGYLPAELDRAGVAYDDVALYRTGPARGDLELLGQLLDRDEVDWVTFTSGSTVAGFWEAVGDRRNFRALCIGPTTAAAAREVGYAVTVSPQATIESMVQTLTAWAQSQSPKSPTSQR